MHFVGARLHPLEPAPNAPPALRVANLVAIDEPRELCRRPLVEGLSKRNAGLLGVLLELAAFPGRGLALPRSNRALVGGQLVVRDHAVEVDLDGAPEAAAGLARADRAVEAEEPRCRAAKRELAARAVKPFRESELRAALGPHRRAPGSPAHRVFERFDQAVVVARPSDRAVCDDVEVRAPPVGDFARPDLVEVADLTCDPNAPIPVRQEGLADTDEVLAVGYCDRIGDQHLLACELAHHALRRARRRVAVDERPTARAVELGGMRPQVLRVVRDLRHRSDRRAARSHGRLTVHSDSDGNWIEQVDRGARQPLEELARVGAEALDVTALALGVERLERQRRLARAGRADDGYKRAGRDVEVDRLQVVRTRASEFRGLHGRDVFLGWRPAMSRSNGDPSAFGGSMWRRAR